MNGASETWWLTPRSSSLVAPLFRGARGGGGGSRLALLPSWRRSWGGRGGGWGGVGGRVLRDHARAVRGTRDGGSVVVGAVVRAVAVQLHASDGRVPRVVVMVACVA